MKCKKTGRNIVTILLVMSMTLGLCSCRVRYKDSNKIQIVTTLFPQYDFARQIAGDKAEVTLLLSPGMEAHSFDPTPADVADINECDLFIYTGEYMEVWAEKIIDSLENDVQVLDVSEGISLVKTEDEHLNHIEDAEISHEHSEDEHLEDEHLEDEHSEDEHSGHEHDGHNHVYDPHIWTSPVMAVQMMENILDKMIEIDPDNADYYRANAQEYISQIEELDKGFREVVNHSNIRTLYFADKFAMYYFAEEYGLNYISVFDSCSSETEPSAKLVAEMIDEVKEHHASAVFYAELSNHKAADTITEETGVKAYLLHSCHNVSKEEMRNGATYVSLMSQNLENLRKGLEESN